MRRLFLTWLTCPLVVFSFGSGLDAQPEREQIDVSSLGPQVGEKIPQFRLRDQNGTDWTRDSIMGPNGALILFHRSADW